MTDYAGTNIEPPYFTFLYKVVVDEMFVGVYNLDL
jgi:hypothetical protein